MNHVALSVVGWISITSWLGTMVLFLVLDLDTYCEKRATVFLLPFVILLNYFFLCVWSSCCVALLNVLEKTHNRIPQ